jgi:GYF domain 2
MQGSVSRIKTVIYLFRNGKQDGPFSIEQVKAQIKGAVLSMSDPAWMDGWPDWKTVADIPDILKPEPTAVQIIREIQPATAEKKINKRGAWCPHCGNRDSDKTTTGLGCLIIIILFFTIIGILLIPFLPKNWKCRVCKHVWRA